MHIVKYYKELQEAGGNMGQYILFNPWVWTDENKGKERCCLHACVNVLNLKQACGMDQVETWILCVSARFYLVP